MRTPILLSAALIAALAVIYFLVDHRPQSRLHLGDRLTIEFALDSGIAVVVETRSTDGGWQPFAYATLGVDTEARMAIGGAVTELRLTIGVDGTINDPASGEQLADSRSSQYVLRQTSAPLEIRGARASAQLQTVPGTRLIVHLIDGVLQTEAHEL